MAKKDDLKALIAAAVEMEDQTNVSSQSLNFPVAPEGRSFARFVEYVELGMQKQRPWKGKPKKDAELVRVGFELVSKANVREVEVNGTKTVISDKIYLTLPKLMSEKAKFFKLLQKMAYGRENITHMAQMLGEGFLVNVVHNHKKDESGKVLRTYANITDADGSFLVQGPFEVDPETQSTKKYKVPEALSEVRMFLWKMPTKNTWDSLFIDGDRTFKDEKGAEKTVSNNWMQEMIMGAANFEGSPIEAMLEGSEDLPDLEEIEELDPEESSEDEFEEEFEEPAPKKVAVKKATVKPAPKIIKPTKKVAPKADKAESDPLEALGLYD